MGRRKDLTERERYQIEVLLKEEKSIRQISEALGRHYMTVYREIRKGTVEMLDSELRPYRRYCADRGQDIADRNKHEKGRELKVANDLEFIRFLEKMILEERYSPNAILMYIKKHGLKFQTEVCYTTIYSYIDKGLLLNVTNKDLPVKSRRKKKNMRRISKVSKNNLRGRSIDERPETILDRDAYGHWEMDTVVGKQGGSKECLLVLTERKTRNEYICRIPDKSQDSVVKALDNLLSIYGLESFREQFKTITMDNGVEFLNMEGIETTPDGEPRTVAYYCHPYCSFERGSNENQNKFVRRWIPKGSDISDFTDEYIQRIQDWMNDYPRAMFGGLSSADMVRLESS